MKITRRQIRHLIKEMSDSGQSDDAEYLSKISYMLDNDPSLENINQMHLLADSISLDMDAFRNISYPAFVKAVENRSDVSTDSIKEFYEIGTSIGFSPEQMKDVMTPAILKLVQSFSKPTMQDIKGLHDLAKSMSLELDLNSIVRGMVEKANVLQQISVDNIIYEIDDVLFRARDEGLKSFGVQSVTALERSGQLNEDDVFDTDMELVYSVKDLATKTIERSIAQVITKLLK